MIPKVLDKINNITFLKIQGINTNTIYIVINT